MANYGKNIYMYKDLSFQLGNTYYDLPIRSERISIAGDSGAGKTFLYNSLQEILPESQSAPSIGRIRNSLRFLNCYDTPDEVALTLTGNKNKLIIIDNADILLNTPDLRELLNDSQNQFILFSRRPSQNRILGEHQGDLDFEGGVFRLRYKERRGERY